MIFFVVKHHLIESLNATWLTLIEMPSFRFFPNKNATLRDKIPVFVARNFSHNATGSIQSLFLCKQQASQMDNCW